jgi:hypothetical protein
MSERKQKINLARIVCGDDFLRELDRAATLSYKGKRESGFVVYSEEALLEPHVNLAVEGEKESIVGEMSPILDSGQRPKPDTGAYIPTYGYCLISLHCHPPKSNLHPSLNDIYHHLISWRTNIIMNEASGEFHRTIYTNEEESELEGFEVDYVAPVSIIGLVRANPKKIELLVYQGITEEPVTLSRFCEFVADYYHKLDGRKETPSDIEFAGFPATRFSSGKRIAAFLNASTYFHAVDIRVDDGKLSEKDLNKLEEFQLIRSRFFPEAYPTADSRPDRGGPAVKGDRESGRSGGSE